MVAVHVGNYDRFWQIPSHHRTCVREENESPRVFRRLVCLSQAAMTDSSSWRYYACSDSAGGTSPIGSSSLRWLNQSTHSSAPYTNTPFRPTSADAEQSDRPAICRARRPRKFDRAPCADSIRSSNCPARLTSRAGLLCAVSHAASDAQATISDYPYLPPPYRLACTPLR